MKSDGLAKNTILLAVGNILTKGLLFVMVPFFSSWLSTEDYGTFDLLCTYVSLLIPVLTLATGEAVFRFSMQAKSEPKKIKYISDSFAITTFNCILTIIVLLIIRMVSGWSLACPFIILLVGELYNNHLQSYLRAIKKLNIYSLCSAFSVIIISILVTVFVRFFGWGLEGIIVGYGLGYLAGDVCIAFATNYFKRIDVHMISKGGMAELIKYSYPLIPNSVSWWIINASDRFIINIVIGATATGIYAIAHKIPSICSAVFGVFNISWQQAASEIVDYGDKEEVEKYFARTYNSVFKRLMSICMGIMSTNFLLFNYIFDYRYIEAHFYTPILITAIIFMLLSQFYGGIQISMKMPKENGVTTVVGAVTNIVINIIFIKLIGLYAAAGSTLISYFIIFALRKEKLNSIVKLKLNKSNYIYIGIYSYFFISSYFIESIPLGFVNLVIACCLFIWMNFDYAIIAKNKLMGKRKRKERV